MLVTSVPTYSVASPCYSYSHQLASPMFVPVPVSPPVQTIPMTVPVQVAVQSPMVQMPPPTTTTYTVFQPVPSVPSPVVHAPVVMSPANPSPVRAPPPQPRHPQPTGDTGNALMLVQTSTPQQAPQSSPNINISVHLPTPQQQPMQLHAVAQTQSVLSRFFYCSWGLTMSTRDYPPERVEYQPQTTATRPHTPSPADTISGIYQTPAGERYSIHIERSPLPGMPPQLPGMAQW